MRKMFSGFPPRYWELLKLTLVMSLFWFISLIPFFLAFYLPLGPWFKILAVFTPVLWFTVVCPARIRYGEMMAAFAKDGAMPLNPRALFQTTEKWRGVCRGRAQLVLWRVMPLCVMLVLLLPLLWFVNPFAAIRMLLDFSTFIATALATIAAFLPRLLMGQSPVAQASILGGVATLTAMLCVSLLMCGWAAFRTSAYRFGYPGMPKGSDMRKLLKNNLFLWMPTLMIALSLFLLSYAEIGLMFANALSVGLVFSVKLPVPELVLSALGVISYVLFLPLRKLNTAVWASAL